jgi:sulfatase maturation enzyme AslB (radical SAM superfamily)
MIYPKRVTIETIYGCNARCIMCPISLPAIREQKIMPLDDFKSIIDKLVPYQEHIEMMDLYGLSEPLLDPHIFERIKYVKTHLDIKSVGISTNAQLLDAKKSTNLFESGLDNIIISVDGFTKETHNQIRRRTDLDRIIANVTEAINIRNSNKYKTRFVLRFIRQELNAHEWDKFVIFWKQILSKEHQDFITAFDVHTHGGEIKTSGIRQLTKEKKDMIDKTPCNVIDDVLYILSDGSVPLCSEDWYQAKFNMGNAITDDPIELFNSKKMNGIRKIHAAGKKMSINKCSKCTLHYGHATKEVLD